MSAVAPPDSSLVSSPATKKKNNKKKKVAKGKNNGDAAAGQDVADPLAEDRDEADVEDSAHTVSKANDTQSAKTARQQTNGHPRDGRIEASDNADASSRFEAMSQEREALRAEVEHLRKSLENIQGKHHEEISSVKNHHAHELSQIQEKHTEEVSTLNELTEELTTARAELTEELTTVRAELAEELTTVRAELTEELTSVRSAKEQAETQYQQLLGRVNTIRASLGERLKADKQELAEAKDQIDDLQAQIEGLERDIKRMEEEANESSKELSSLRNRHNLSQQNWVHEREDLTNQSRLLKDEAEAARDAMGDWEVLAMEEKRMRESLTERVADLEEQYSSQKEAYDAAVAERDTQSQTVGGLQRALQEVQEARKRELREMVESYEEQIQSLKNLVQDSDTRASEADALKGALRAELDRIGPFEAEVNEKNLLIGKLRHEAIVLNDHLTKALRFLKKAKPEDNIDRQIVTNHFLHFLALDRTDAKKFQVLQLIAALLNWTDEQKEQAGLARPGTSNNSLRLPSSPFHRTPSTPSLSSDFFNEPPASKESLADLWTGFLERSAEEGVNVHSRSGSVSGSSRKADASGDGGNSKQ